MDKEERARILKIGIGIVFLAFVIGSSFATQEIAEKCTYDPLLGEYYKIGEYNVYPPYKYFVWRMDYGEDIPNMLKEAENTIYLCTIIGFLISGVFASKSIQKSTHGTARWANEREITKAKVTETSGVIIGINPYTKKLLRHNGPEHLLLMAPTRSGKGVGVIIPTCFTWVHSIFVLDVKGENWNKTSGYRKNVLKQIVMKFAPLSTDGSSLRWNPLSEIHFHDYQEYGDVQIIIEMLVSQDDKKNPDFWSIAGTNALIGVVLHLFYQHYIEKKALPTLTDVDLFFCDPNRNIDEQMRYMMEYPHISVEDFFENNVLQKIYGEYIKDFTPYNEALHLNISSLDELKEVLKEYNVDFTEEPFNRLLVHPRVAACAKELYQRSGDEKSGVVSTAKGFLNLYQNPIIERNTSVSDFKISDLLDKDQAVSFYLIVPYREIAVLKPLVRLLLNSILRTLIQEVETEKVNNPKKNMSLKEQMIEMFRSLLYEKEEISKGTRKQRLLLMLDEFPQFGRLDMMEKAMAVCAGYGIKMCVVCQDINQLKNAYTKENSITANCQIQIFFRPNYDEVTAPYISKVLGTRTITANSNTNQGFLKGSTSTSDIGRDLLKSDEVYLIPNNRGIIFSPGQRPIYSIKLAWYDEPFFLKKEMEPLLFSDEAHAIKTYDDLLNMYEDERKVADARREKIKKLRRVRDQQLRSPKRTDEKE